MTVLNPGMYGEMFTVVPIYAAAVLLGLVSGVVAVQLFVAGAGRLSLRSLMGIVALAAFFSCLVAAKPDVWAATASFWAMAAVVMAFVELSVVRFIDPWRATQLFSNWSVRRRIAWPMIGMIGSIAGVLAVLKVCFDIPLNTEYVPSFAAKLAVAILILALLDFAVHLAVIRWSRWRRIRAAGH